MSLFVDTTVDRAQTEAGVAAGIAARVGAEAEAEADKETTNGGDHYPGMNQDHVEIRPPHPRQLSLSVSPSDRDMMQVSLLDRP